MSFDWNEYIVLAQRLAQATGQASSEAELRSAVSRAYYAAYHRARLHLERAEGRSIPPNVNGHQYIPRQFRMGADQARKEIAENLTRLRRDRNKADYDDIVAGLPSMTTKDLLLAMRTIAQIGAL